MNTIPRERPRTRQDKRALWSESPELRDSVKDDLIEWGRAQKGGFPDLGYPQNPPFTVEPQRMPPAYDADKVDAITDTLTMWNLVQRMMGTDKQRAMAWRLRAILIAHFISNAPAESIAKKFRISRRTFWRQLDEAMYRFWRMHY